MQIRVEGVRRFQIAPSIAFVNIIAGFSMVKDNGRPMPGVSHSHLVISVAKKLPLSVGSC